jgi:hypothetical protein
MRNERLKWLIFITMLLVVKMAKSQQHQLKDTHLLKRMLLEDTAFLSRFTANGERYKIQIIYTQINRDSKNRPRFMDFSYHLDANRYFYPASSVKMPLAILALQRCRELGIPVTASMLTDSSYAGQELVVGDNSSANGLPSISHYIKKIFLVSDNDASNRLYEFLGQDYIHAELRRMGLPGAEIIHRLSIPLSEEQNRRTNPVKFLDEKGQLVYEQPEKRTARVYPERSDFVGKGYMKEEKLVAEQMDFSKKNRFPLEDLHRMLQMVMFPEVFPKDQIPLLGENDYQLLYQYMSQFPRESGFPAYDQKEFYDSYVKFFLFGTKKDAEIPGHIRIFNKVGWSYGFLTDVAYVVDLKNQVEFFLSATIYCNEDEILNDDKYDYETIGLPFLERLGQVVYEYELGRKKKHLPDLSRFKIQYD